MLEYEINLDIDFSDDYDLESIYINLKSPKIKNIKDSDIFDIISNNGIILKDLDGWKGVKESYLSIEKIEKERLDLLINIFDKYTNLYYLPIDTDEENYSIFVINKELTDSYYKKINKYLKDNYDLEDVNIYLTISNNFNENTIQNYSNFNLNHYLNLNCLDKISKRNFEFIIPKNISSIINQLKNNQLIEKENQEIIAKFKLTWFKILEESDNYGSINLKIYDNEQLFDMSSGELTTILKLI